MQNRRQVFESAEAITRCAAAATADRNSEQIGLFSGSTFQQPPRLHLADVPDWPPMERLSEELEAVGFYLSAHPLDTYGAKLKRLKSLRFADLLASGRSGSATFAGTVIAKRERTSGKGTRYAFVQLSDTSGVFEVTVFSELLASERDKLEPGCSLLLHVNAQFEGEGVRCVAQRIESLDEAVDKLTDSVDVFLDSPAPLSDIRAALADAGPGRGQIRLVAWLDGAREVEIAVPSAWRITGALVGRLRAIPGIRDVREV